MQICFYSAQPYDRQFFDETIADNAVFAALRPVYQEASLNAHSVALAEGAAAVCVFVNDTLDAEVIAALAGT